MKTRADEEFEVAMEAEVEPVRAPKTNPNDEISHMMRRFRDESRARLPKNDLGECVCDKCGRVIPEPETYCEPCSAIERVAREKRKRVLEINKAFDRCAGYSDAFRFDDTPALPNWQWARLDNPQFRRAVSQKLLRAVERWLPPMGNLMLCANSGDGKTSLITARLYQFRDQALAQIEAGEDPKWFPFVFVSALDLVAARRTHKLGSSEPPIIARAMGSMDVLFLDEVGYEDNRDQLILELADRRYRNRARTIVTTGRTPAAFADRYGVATYRKLTEGGHVIEDFPEAK